MSLLTTIIGYAKRFFAWEYWPYLIAILALITIILAVVYLIKKRRGKDDKKKPKPPEAEKEKKEEGIPVSSLAKVWKGFLKEIPWELRRSIMVYEHFVVFGEAGAGKGSGVTLIYAVELKVAAHIQTGAGHHEIALTTDDQVAFVTNKLEAAHVYAGLGESPLFPHI